MDETVGALQIQLKVLDLSHYNNVLDYGMLYDQGIRGVIFKATQGAGMVDSTFVKSVPRALAAKLLVGAYHFGTSEDPARQVAHFLSVVEETKTQMLLALDFEDLAGASMSVQQARTFLSEVRNRAGVKPVLYSGNRLKDHVHAPDLELTAYRLWLAQYGPRPVCPPGWTKPWLWQFSDGQVGPFHLRLKGVSGLVDLNSYQGDDTQLVKEWLNG